MIVMGFDPALGGGTAQVICDLGDKLVILDAITTYDLSRTEEQIDLIKEWVIRYHPCTSGGAPSGTWFRARGVRIGTESTKAA